MSKALSVQEQSTRAVQRAERKVIKRTQNLIERGVLDASRIDDDGMPVRPQDQEVVSDARRHRIAMDMRQSKRNAPLYIDVGLRRLENAEKLDAAEKVGAMVQLNVGTVNIVQAPQYDVIDVTPGRK